jgi:serine/threonine protein kinase
VEALLGKGGMGAVYRARLGGTGPPVALKILLPREDLDTAAEELFLREIEVTRALRHPNIVSLLEFGRHEGRMYVALEYCARGSAEKLRRERGGRVPLPSVVRIALGCAEGLAAAHEAGFVHRDLKPDNVLLAEDGTARIADFGLAKSFQQTGLSGMTATGAVAGTFHFMPREQLTAYRQVRPVSDVWSLAATLYFLLTGEYARDFESHHDPLAVILRGGTVPLRQRDPSVPEELARVIDKALADAPESRYPDARALASALRQVL